MSDEPERIAVILKRIEAVLVKIADQMAVELTDAEQSLVIRKHRKVSYPCQAEADSGQNPTRPDIQSQA